MRARASIARDKAFCAEVLRQAGVPVLPGRDVLRHEALGRDARAGARTRRCSGVRSDSAEYPIFCKPLSASNGLYAEVIESAEAFADYMARVAREHFAILIQPYVRAPEYRVFVLKGGRCFRIANLSPHVVGDGARTLRALVRSAAARAA